MVSVSGLVFTGRDRVHRYLSEGGRCPVSLRDGAIYHCGPVVLGKKGGWVVRAAGPTTSARQESYMSRIIEKHHVRVIIGKGGMDNGTRNACARFGCVYLQAVGGAAAAMAERVEKVVDVHFLDEFGPAEAVWEFIVRDLRAVVAIDTGGRSLHRKVKTASKKALRGVMGT